MQCVVVSCSQVVVSLGGSDYSIFEPFNDYSVKEVQIFIFDYVTIILLLTTIKTLVILPYK